MSKLEQVVDIFKDSLEDEDTYIYLSAINGLVASARYYKNICCLMWSVENEWRTCVHANVVLTQPPVLGSF